MYDFDKYEFLPREEETKRKSRILPSNILLRTKLCKFYPLGECKRGKRCAFAHDESALRDQPDLTKTSLCQNMLEGFCENGNDCVYAHSHEELRIVEEAELNSETENEDKPMRRRRRRRAGRGTEPERRISDGLNSSGDFDPEPATNVLRTGNLQSRSSNFHFRTKLCLYNEGGICKRGEECEFPHRPASLRDTPDLRTPICQDYMNGFCSLGGYCSYVHSTDDPRALEVEVEKKESSVLLDFDTNNIATLKLPSVDQHFDPSFLDENHLSDSLTCSKLTKSQSTDVRTRSTFEDFYSRYYPSRTLGRMVKLDSFDDEGL